MQEAFQFALLGLGAGAVYALLAQGLVVIHRGSGVLNLAQGAFAMIAAYVNYELHVTHGIATIPAICIAVAFAALLGALTDVLLMRRLRGSSPLTRLIATLGVLLVLQSAATIRWGNDPIFVASLFPAGTLRIFGATISTERLLLVVIAVAVTIVLTVVWRYTKFGWVTTAVSENQRAAAALGWSPSLVSMITWAVGAGMAGLAGVLVAPITQLSVPNLTVIVIAGLAAALIGGFTSFPRTLAGGLLLGVLQSETGNYVQMTGAADVLPFALIVIVLVVRGTALPIRGHLTDRLPRVGTGFVSYRLIAIVVAASVVVLAVMQSESWTAALTASLGVATVLLSIVVVTGYAGLVSLAQYALAGIGALCAARLVAAMNWPFLLAALAGVVVAALVALVFAVPALRTRGVNFTVVTIGLGLATQSALFNNGDYTGGGSGTTITSLDIFGWDIDPAQHPARYSIVALIGFTLCALLVANLRRGRSGRRLLAVRANERAAAAAGINVWAAKMHAFGVSGAIAGVGGILLAFSTSTITFGRFGPLDSISAIAFAVIGGVGMVLGSIIGALFAPSGAGSLIFNFFGSSQTVQEYLPLIGGVGVLLTLLSNPDGLALKASQAATRLAGRWLPKPAPPVNWSEIANDQETAGGDDRVNDNGESQVSQRVVPRTLVVENLTVRYGGITAVDGVSLTVKPGEVIGLIGPNGAGKTSLMDAITGFTPYTGSVRLDDTTLDGRSAHRRARAGLIRSFQSLELFEDLTLLENFQSASDRRDAAAMVTDLVRPGREPLSWSASLAIREFGLQDDLHRRPAELSYGRRRLAAVARAVAGGPSVLLLDEPVAGLDQAESLHIAHLVRSLANRYQIGVLVIEHDLDFVMTLCDRIHVVDFGRPVASGTGEQIRANPAAIAAYLGTEDEQAEVAQLPAEQILANPVPS